MMAFGQKIILLSSIIILIWLGVGYFMYRKSLEFVDENNKLLNQKSLEQEITECKTGAQKLNSGFWQRINLFRLKVPDSLKESLSVINVKSNSAIVQDTKVHYIYARPKELKSNMSILLLHGQSFTSETWNEIGTIKILAAFGYYAIAVDLPGYGQSPLIKDLNKSSYVDNLITTLNIKKPILVSPSMSGSFSLRYLMAHPEKLGGYVPISPVHTNILSESSCPDKTGSSTSVVLNKDCERIMHHLKSKDLKLDCIKVPSLVIWGERDRGENSARLCLLPESQGVEIPDGRHPAYLSNPDLWHKLLYNFLSVLNDTQVCRHDI